MSMLSAQCILSQDSIPVTVHVLQKVEKNKIILRWVPSSAVAWHAGLKYGYKIERIENKYGSAEMNEFQTIATQVLPWSKDKWQKEKADTYDDYNLMVAEMVYGKKSKKAQSGNFISMAEDFQSRYTISMMAADFSSQAADALGVRYEDVNVKPGFVYIYKVTSLVPETIALITNNITIANASALDTLEQPQLHRINSGDGIVHVLWAKNSDIFTKYPAYFVERTDDDGKTFKKLHEKPYISSNPFGEEYNEYFIYTDSVPQNYKQYGYRIKGITPFADIGPPSEVIYGMGRDFTPPPPPYNMKSIQNKNNTIDVTWDYPVENSSEIKGFYVARSTDPLTNFENITTIILPANTRKFTDAFPDQQRPNFYIVASIDTAGNYALSTSQYAHMIDSIAPAPPINIKGVVNKNGQVQISWTKNSEKDIMGYTIHYSNHPDHEFVAITNKPILDTFYRDTVMIKTLTEKIYYKIVAFDKSYNSSKFSEVLILSIPDIVPPSSPIVVECLADENKIKISWINSSSQDAAKHILYRRDSIKGNWNIIFETINKEIHSFDDQKIQPIKKYYYKIHAVDEVNNLSLESIIMQSISKFQPIEYANLELKVTKKQSKAILSWKALPDIKHYTIYKTDPNGQFISIGITSETKFEDIPDHNSIQYALRATTSNGLKHGFTKSVSIVLNE